MENVKIYIDASVLKDGLSCELSGVIDCKSHKIKFKRLIKFDKINPIHQHPIVLLTILIAVKLCGNYGIKNATIYSHDHTIYNLIENDIVSLEEAVILNEIHAAVRELRLEINYEWIRRDYNIAYMSPSNVLSTNSIDKELVKFLDITGKFYNILHKQGILVFRGDSPIISNYEPDKTIFIGNHFIIFEYDKIRYLVITPAAYFIGPSNISLLSEMVLAVSYACGLSKRSLSFKDSSNKILKHTNRFCKEYKIGDFCFDNVKIKKYKISGMR